MAARARDALTNIYYKKRKMKETVYHSAFIMLRGGGGCFGVRFCCGEVGLHTVYLFFFINLQNNSTWFSWGCLGVSIKLGYIFVGIKKKKKKKRKKKTFLIATTLNYNCIFGITINVLVSIIRQVNILVCLREVKF